MLVGGGVAVVAGRVAEERTVCGRVTADTTSLGTPSHLARRTEQRQELAAEPAPEEVVRDDVHRRVEEDEEVGGLVEGVEREVGESARRVVGEGPDDARDEGGELADEEDDDDADQHHGGVDTPRHGRRRPRPRGAAPRRPRRPRLRSRRSFQLARRTAALPQRTVGMSASQPRPERVRRSRDETPTLARSIVEEFASRSAPMRVRRLNEGIPTIFCFQLARRTGRHQKCARQAIQIVD